MKASFCSSFIITTALLFAALSNCRSEDFIGISPDPDDPQFAFYTQITDEMTAGQPEWDPISQPPPKSIQELSKIALDLFIPGASQPKTGWKVTGVEFRQVPASWHGDAGYPPARKNRWYCCLRLAAFGDYKGEWWKNHAEIYMLLDGTLIKSERRKAPAHPQPPKAP